jgi:EmrB/QacA subfamily drug resistance transporter
MTLMLRGPCEEESIRSAGRALPSDRGTRRWVLAAAVLGSSIAFIDGTVVNVALPVIQERLAASVTSAQWVIEAYTLGLSALLLLGGALGDRLGRRRVFVAGVAIFTLASAVCGLVPSVGALIAARAVQGVGGALLIPGSLALIGSVFPAEERGRAIGAWSSMTAVASVVGPVLGGWLVETVSWRAAFWINLPLAIGVMAIASWKVPESRQADSPPLDLAGAALATTGLAALVFGLIEFPGSALPRPLLLGMLTFGMATFALFLRVEQKSAHPMVPLDLFRSRAFLGANLVTLFLYAGLAATMLFLSFDLIQAQGFRPAAAGAAMVPFIVLVSLLSRWSGGLLDRVGPRLPLTAGPALAAAGFALLAIPSTGAGYWTGFFPGICVLGLGLAVTVPPLTTVVMNAVDSSREGLASGINNAVSRIGGLLAVAVLGLVVTAVFSGALDRRLESSGLGAVAGRIPAAERLKLGTVRPPADLPQGDAAAASRAIAAALADSFRVVALTSAALALCAAGTAGWLFGGRSVRTETAAPRIRGASP